MNTYFSKELLISSDLIAIDKKAILKSLEIPEGQEDSYTNELIDSYEQQLKEKIAPKISYALFEKPVFKKDEMQIAGHNFALGKRVLAGVKKSSHIAFFVATAGDAVETLSKQLQKEGHLLEGLIVDLIGSEIAESLAEITHQKVADDMLARNLMVTNRFSPGYCSWPVSDQQKLFELMGKNTCGVELTKSSLMMPIKSVSGIIGIGTNVKKRPYACSKCDIGYCIYRDKK